MFTNDASSLQSPLRDPTVHITTHNASGKATIYSSQSNPKKVFPNQDVVISVAYTTSTMPVDLNNNLDITQHQETIANGKLGLVNPNGTVCRFVDFAPGNRVMTHRTQSLDYGIVLEGNVLMELDDGSSTLIRRGDVAVQRATMHGWKNASDTEWARMLFVLQDCKPLVVGGARLGENLGDDGVKAFGNSGNDR
ncbi:hypothetical protein GQ53DRAFT_507016 [Thozetella sp. PMI_491]|nr:hypothetical protein GQ53DRAFT_507016 [Thozetella sp. PMI_491]